MPPPKRSTAAILVWGVAAAVILTVLLAPIVTVGWCADSAVEGDSLCGSSQQSLIGVQSDIWIWLFAMGVVVVGTVLSLRRARRDRPKE